MRGLTVLAAAALAIVPMTATAQDAEASNVDTTEITDKLTDPEFQAQMSDAMRAMSGVLMEMPVGPLIEAAGKMSSEMGDGAVPDVDPDATVRDLAGDKAEQATDEMAERLPQMMNSMAGMTDAMAAMLPALEAMAKQMQGAFKPAR